MSVSATDLPYADPNSGSDSFKAVFSDECESYDALVQALESGGEVTVTASEARLSYEPAMSLLGTIITLEEYSVESTVITCS